MKKDIILIGGGGHCSSVIDVIEQTGNYNISGIVDIPDKKGETLLGYDFIGTDDDLPEIFKSCQNAVITIGQIKTNEPRIKAYNLLKNIGFSLPVIISPRAYVSPHAKIGEGTVIMHDALINASASIGKNCIINTKALIEHDAVIGNNCHISTASVVNGGAFIKDNTFFGSNSVSAQGAIIEGFIKAGQTAK